MKSKLLGDLFGGILLVLALAEFVFFRTSAQAIEAGKPFFYGAQVDVLDRPPFFLVWFVAILCWFFLRPVFAPLRRVSPIFLGCVTVALLFFCLITPLANVPQRARSLQSLPTEAGRYALYAQYHGLDPACQYVLVVCESAGGFYCHYVDAWDSGAVCLGNYENIRLQRVGTLVSVEYQDTMVFERTIP